MHYPLADLQCVVLALCAHSIEGMSEVGKSLKSKDQKELLGLLISENHTWKICTHGHCSFSSFKMFEEVNNSATQCTIPEDTRMKHVLPSFNKLRHGFPLDFAGCLISIGREYKAPTSFMINEEGAVVWFTWLRVRLTRKNWMTNRMTNMDYKIWTENETAYTYGLGFWIVRPGIHLHFIYQMNQFGRVARRCNSPVGSTMKIGRAHV